MDPLDIKFSGNYYYYYYYNYLILSLSSNLLNNSINSLTTPSIDITYIPYFFYINSAIDLLPLEVYPIKAHLNGKYGIFYGRII